MKELILTAKPNDSATIGYLLILVHQLEEENPKFAYKVESCFEEDCAKIWRTK